METSGTIFNQAVPKMKTDRTRFSLSGHSVNYEQGKVSAKRSGKKDHW